MNKLTTLIAMLALAGPATAQADCGDNVLDEGEACDDANTTAGDGCAADCTVEDGFACAEQTPLEIVNGSFEAPLNPSNWTVVGSIDQLRGRVDCYPAADGDNSIDINGMMRGEVYQDLATAPGEHYLVSFLASANCREVSGDACDETCEKDMTVSAGVGDVAFASSTYTTQGSPLSSAGFQRYTFEFTAIADTTRLRFSGTDASLAGSILDLVVSPRSVCGLDTCGNSSVESHESCDDANHVGGDGCSSSCQIEPGYMCPSPGEPCKPDCGDGLKVEGEECDDAAPSEDGDGCSAECTIEDGWSCVIDPLNAISVCTMGCGDGTVDAAAGEVCDDGNDVDTDACSNSCLLGPGEACVLDAECNLRDCPEDREVCGGCYDTGDGEDLGCGGLTPHCFVGSMPLICVQCITDADCGADGPCDAATHTCASGPRPDAGSQADASTSLDGGVVTPRPGAGVTGGALCSASAGEGAPAAGLGLLLLAALALVLRRQR